MKNKETKNKSKYTSLFMLVFHISRDSEKFFETDYNSPVGS